MPFYFAYGSNMLRARLEARVGRVEDFGWATLHEFRHAFNKLGRDGSGKGNINPHPRSAVHGVVYAVADGQLERLHGFEGGYRAVELEVAVRAGGLRLHAVSYRARDPVQSLSPTDEYLDYYVRGMREHGLPDAYLRAILAGV